MLLGEGTAPPYEVSLAWFPSPTLSRSQRKYVGRHDKGIAHTRIGLDTSRSIDRVTGRKKGILSERKGAASASYAINVFRERRDFLGEEAERTFGFSSYYHAVNIAAFFYCVYMEYP